MLSHHSPLIENGRLKLASILQLMTKAGITLHGFKLATSCYCPPPPRDADVVTTSCSVRVYSNRTRQRHNDGVKHNTMDLEHVLVNRGIQTGRVASKILYNTDAVDLTLARPV